MNETRGTLAFEGFERAVSSSSFESSYAIVMAGEVQRECRPRLTVRLCNPQARVDLIINMTSAWLDIAIVSNGSQCPSQWAQRRT